MTTQDWWPALADEDQEPAPPPRRRRWGLAGAALTVVLVLAALGVVLASHRGSSGPATSVTAAAGPSSPSAADTPANTPRAGSIVIKAALRDPRLSAGSIGEPDPLVVGTQPLQGGAAPERVPNFDTCHADTATLQYLPVQIRGPWLGLTATVTVQTTASTPPGIGRLGFFFQAGSASTPCPNGAWSASDSFQASNYGQEVITGYIVLDHAFTPSTRQGRADVFRTLQLRVSNISAGGIAPLVVSPPSVGSLCPGTQNELCAALS